MWTSSSTIKILGRRPAPLGPGEAHLARAHEAGEVIDVPVGLVVEYALAEPDHPAHVQVRTEQALETDPEVIADFAAAVGSERRLTALYLAAAIPFFFTGLLFSVVFARESRHITRLYGADLVGGAVHAGRLEGQRHDRCARMRE